MSITEIIRRKRDGGELSEAEIACVVDGAATGAVADYQLSAFLMAVYFAGMTPGETALLTMAMARSGAVLHRSGTGARRVDKHSTGGVGDKVSLILAPIVASCGIAVPMISGRGLGHTGGTVDKLESIPGFRAMLSLAEVERQVAELGIAMAAQTEELAPADRCLYALRDVTATVESLPLITASILSKKFAESLDALVMDVKCGPAAFMRNRTDAHALAASIMDVARANGLPCRTLITRMDGPLGRRIGNWHEVCESVRVLRGEEEPPLLMEVTLALAGEAIEAGGAAAPGEGAARARRAIADGSAWETFIRMVEHQGGDVATLERAAEPPATVVVRSERAGFVAAIDSLRLGLLSIGLGAGRRTMNEAVAPEAGIVVHAHLGEEVRPGDPVCSVANGRGRGAIDPLAFRACFTVNDAPPPPAAMILQALR
ncbi:MAG TPA: thymidine phosphorylase [Candidatus Kapabacteria bacterium]|nr:thymidine phosphorylase [Candidatus Kapabacteria bacterium]